MNRESEGDALLKQAEKLCMPSVLQLRLKPDWPAATPLFEKAAASYSVRQLKLYVSQSCPCSS